jgi:glycosyltransferase involved in cell wall biosynthesis
MIGMVVNDSVTTLMKHRGMAADRALFEQARRHYLEKKFAKAQILMQKYRQSLRYELIEKQDSRIGPKPAVSVVVVSYGAGQRLLECLDSLGQQTDSDFEIIVVDNGGNQEILGHLANLPILHVMSPFNLLPSEGRNVGAHFARGDILAFLDDDALTHPDYVKSVRSAWELFDFTALRGRILQRSASSVIAVHYDLGPYPVPAVLMTEGNMAIKKDVFSAIGGFDPLVFGGEGTELTYRCLKAFPDKDIYYWPHMIVSHDFARGKDFAAKKRRHAIASEYFHFLAPEIEQLQTKYCRWYESRPGKVIGHSQRPFSTKARAWLLEKWTILTAKM